jgi:hypothetical protein
VLASWGTIAPENAHSSLEWEAKEKEQAPIIAKDEADRLAAIDTAKAELARYEPKSRPASPKPKRSASPLAASQASGQGLRDQDASRRGTKLRGDRPRARTYTEWSRSTCSIPRRPAA